MPPFLNMLFDRDGTLIKDKHYLADPAGVELLPHAGESLAGLAGQGPRFFVVSNQSGVGRGFFSLESVHACNARMAELFARYGVVFTDMAFCPHAPDEHCRCRKPAPGMWEGLCKAHKLNPLRSIMVGDKKDDLLFAANAGLAARVLVLTGKGGETAEKLGLALPQEPVLRVWKRPSSPEHPHICISNLALLAEGLRALAAEREGACGA